MSLLCVLDVFARARPHDVSVHDVAHGQGIRIAHGFSSFFNGSVCCIVAHRFRETALLQIGKDYFSGLCGSPLYTKILGSIMAIVLLARRWQSD
jgi:predicted membrane protein